MGASERFDEWAAGVDDLLGAPRVGAASETLEDVYDAETVAAIERGVEPQRPTPRWWSGAAAGALTLGSLTGGRDDAERDDEAVIEIERVRAEARLEAVSVHLVWGDPAAGVAVVRRWLL